MSRLGLNLSELCGIGGCSVTRDSPLGIRQHRNTHPKPKIHKAPRPRPLRAAAPVIVRIHVTKTKWRPFIAETAEEMALLAEALYAVDDEGESPEQSAVVTALIIRLEAGRRFVARSRHEEELLRSALAEYAPESAILRRLRNGRER